MSSVRFAVIGLGDFGERHVRALKAVHGVEVVAVCSRTERRAREVAERYGIPKWYTSRAEVVEDPAVDAVTIATADDDHVEPTVLAAEASKHILLEKPIATTLEDADRILAAVKKAGVIFMVGHILRFDLKYRMVKEMVDEGRLGKIIKLYARRVGRKSLAKIFLPRVSPPVQTAVHDIDVMLWYMGERVVEVYGAAANFLGYRYPDVFWTVMKFEGGAIGAVENGFNLPDSYPYFIDAKLDLQGDKGLAHIDVPGETFTVYTEDRVEKPDIVYWPIVMGEGLGALKDELEYFARCVERGEQPDLIKPEDARAALEVAVAAERSSVEGRPVRL
jgi:predicted dehydrogenase